MVPKSFADSSIAAQEPTTAYVSSLINAAIAANSLQSQAYVNNSNAQLAQKTTVDTADTAYVPVAKLNAANGVAGLDSSGNLLSAQIPSGIQTDNVMRTYDVYGPAGTLTLSGSQTVTTSNVREYQIGSIVVPDPGYPWLPIPFAMVQGGAITLSAPSNRYSGTGTYGLLSVLPPVGVSNQVYGVGLCTDSYYLNFYPVFGYGATNQTPTTVPPVTGGLELDLCACCWTGSGYTFTSTALQYWILVVPAAT
jgi:hypothetical protein